jgi:hypothetical protein
MRNPSRKIYLAVAGLLWTVACHSPQPGTSTTNNTPPVQSPVERGAYIVKTAACNDCHTPVKLNEKGEPEPDMSRMLSGHPENAKLTKPPKLEGSWMAAASNTFTAWYGPWGVSFTANLTPDPSGLAAWDEGMFIRAIREGKHMGQSRPILPPMPWPVYRNFTDDDLKAVFAYLKTIPPVSNHVPDPIPPDQVAKMK